jgi:geranyl-CoA carboxylase alpha subunit
MVKASAGGGGRGMRLVNSADELPAALSTARSEAQNAFGSGELILEKAVIAPRHVEIQILVTLTATAFTWVSVIALFSVVTKK